ncbi:uncharacterized protein ARMOST_02592 [Armillaria ostoyae]|uniref:Uncharacterized protein n=1 Tax=Armillaria ostoyae TaxID=47428 RepID=A0A284QS45_ARMOS|nr:uncharacterized protein ARMOST_02592 [Armillaria ostoyae]
MTIFVCQICDTIQDFAEYYHPYSQDSLERIVKEGPWTFDTAVPYSKFMPYDPVPRTMPWLSTLPNLPQTRLLPTSKVASSTCAPMQSLARAKKDVTSNGGLWMYQ